MPEFKIKKEGNSKDRKAEISVKFLWVTQKEFLRP